MIDAVEWFANPFQTVCKGFGTSFQTPRKINAVHVTIRSKRRVFLWKAFRKHALLPY